MISFKHAWLIWKNWYFVIKFILKMLNLSNLCDKIFQIAVMGRPRSKSKTSDSEETSERDKMYTCVNCGYLSPQIYKTYSLSSENLMKLLNCVSK